MTSACFVLPSPPLLSPRLRKHPLASRRFGTPLRVARRCTPVLSPPSRVAAPLRKQHVANMALHPMLVETAITVIVYQASFFLITYLNRFDTLTDFAGTSNFILLALQTFLHNQPPTYRARLVTASVILWATRLGTYLLYRILKWGRDKRFDDKRDDVKSLAVFWSLQACWVWLVSLPVTLVNGTVRNVPVGGVRDVVALGMFAVGLVVETVADWQKLAHKQRPGARWMTSGLWKYSRHPNYFGEILLWWAVYILAMPVLRGWQFMAILSPLVVCLLLLFLSGIPILERSGDRKWGADEEYVRYKKDTSVVVPLPVGMYGKLPRWIKRSMFFELDMYNTIGERRELAEGGGG